MQLKSLVFILVFIFSYAANSQSLQIFDIDTTDFPTMRAKFYAIDKDGKPSRPDKNELELFEAGFTKPIKEINCPKNPPRKLSVAIMVDTYFYIELAKNGTKKLINYLNMPNDELGITYMNYSPLIFQDFINDKSKALKKAENIPFAPGGTSVNEMFNTTLTGGISFIKNRNAERKILILISDLHCPNLDIDEQKLISEANANNIAIYSVLLNSNDYTGIFGRIAEATGARIFEDIRIDDQFVNIFEEIPKIQQYSPCILEWESEPKCKTGNIEVTLEWNNLFSTSQFVNPTKGIAKLEFCPKYISFGRIKPNSFKDTILKITAINSDFNVLNTKMIHSSNIFSIIDKDLPFKIQKNQTIDLKVRFSPIDSILNFEELEFDTDLCAMNIHLSGGFPEYRNKKATLKIMFPNGNEKLIVGSDTTINWTGISKDEAVRIDFSNDNGKNWKILSTDARGLNYKWKNIPLPQNDSSLIKITQISEAYETFKIPDIDWTKIYGGTSVEEAVDVLELENGYIFLGNSQSYDKDVKWNYGQFDCWVIKTDIYGNIEWQNNYGGTLDDKAFSIIKAIDGGFIIVGGSKSNNYDVKTGNKGDYDYWILKINDDGDVDWYRSYGGSKIDIANSIDITKDNGYVIAGYSASNDGDISDARQRGSDYWVLKINVLGDILWQKKLGGSYIDEGKAILSADDGSFLVGGNIMSTNGDIISGNKGKTDYWFVKLDSLGNIIWEKNYGGMDTEEFTTMAKTQDGGFIVGGRSESKDGDVKGRKSDDSNIWLLKLDANGKVEWSQDYGGSNFEYLSKIVELSDGSFLLFSYSSSNDGDLIGKNKGGIDYWVIRLSKYGKIVWNSNYGSSFNEVSGSIAKTKDKGAILVGTLGANIEIVKLFSDIEAIQSDQSDSVFSIIAPEPRFDKLNVDMGQVIVNGMKDTLVTAVFCNQGDARLHVLGVDVTAGDTSEFQVPRGAGEFYLEAGECRDLMFEFMPNQLGMRQAKVTVRTTIGDYKDTISIVGEGVQPKLQLLTEFVDFGVKEIYTEKDSTIVLIKNASNFPITIDSIASIGPDTTQFKLQSSLTSFTLQANESKSIDIKFLPKFNGRTSGRIAFYYNQVGSPSIAQLFGAGLGARAIISKDSAFPGQKITSKIFLNNTNPKILSEFVSRVEGIARFESSILAPNNQNNILKIQNDSTYIKFTGIVDESSNYLTGIELIAGLGLTDESTIDIEELKWFDKNGLHIEYDTEISSGHFKLLGVCYEGGARLINPSGQAAQILSISPNPAENWLDLEVSLIEKGTTEISIFNINGEKVKTLLKEEINTTGTFKLSSNLLDISSGQYYIILTTPTYIETNQLMIVK